MAMMQPGQFGISDRDIAEDILSSEKYVTDIYSKAVVEASDQRLRDTLHQIYSDMQHNAKRIYDYLNARGWYRPIGADQQRINELRATVDETKRAVFGVGMQPGIAQGPQAGMAGYGGYGGFAQPSPGSLPGWARFEPGGRAQQQQAGQQVGGAAGATGPTAAGGYWGAYAFGGPGGGQPSLPGWATQEISQQESPAGQPTRPRGQPEMSGFGGYAYGGGGGHLPGWATQETSMQEPTAGQP
ncbi:MAG TPA: spore coat protein, partial [Clostridia bacterium]|nr:spore coat protein [Clostridia bacterium]